MLESIKIYLAKNYLFYPPYKGSKRLYSNNYRRKGISIPRISLPKTYINRRKSINRGIRIRVYIE